MEPINDKNQNALNPGSLLNHSCFRILEKKGQGGFGITYLAEKISVLEDLGDGHYQIHPMKSPEKVVVKELFYQDFCSRDNRTNMVNITSSDKKVEFQKLVDKMVEEGRYLRSLNHPHIVKNTHIFKDNGTAYIVMEYLEGQDLSDILDASINGIGQEKAIKYISQIAEALIEVHAKNLLHLDIKPSNIFIKNNTDDAILIDFGASLSYDDEGKVKSTTSKLVTGVSYYAPPEQRSLEGIKNRNNTIDTFSLSGTLYHCLTGHKPEESVNRVSKDELKRPSTYNLPISDYFDAVLNKGLQLRYEKRIKTAQEFLTLLNGLSAYHQKLNEAEQHFKNKQYEKAANIIQEADGIAGSTPTTLNRYNEYLQANEADGVISGLAEFIKQAQQFENKNDYKEALNYYILAQKLRPYDITYKQKIEYCKSKLKDKETEVLETEVFVANRLKEVKTLRRQKDYGLALMKMGEILQKTPANKEVQLLKIEIENEKRNNDDINAEALLMRANDNVKGHFYSFALEQFDEIKSLYPGFSHMYKVDEAIKRCKELMKSPKPPASSTEAGIPKWIWYLISGAALIAFSWFIWPGWGEKVPKKTEVKTEQDAITNTPEIKKVTAQRFDNSNTAAKEIYDYFIYTGRIQNGKPETDEKNMDSLRVTDSKGVYYKDGKEVFTYTGKYSNGLMNGYGEQLYSVYTRIKSAQQSNDVQKMYSGEFKDDMIQGKGTVYLVDGSYLEGTFVNNQCTAGTWYDKNHKEIGKQ